MNKHSLWVATMLAYHVGSFLNGWFSYPNATRAIAIYIAMTLAWIGISGLLL